MKKWISLLLSFVLITTFGAVQSEASTDSQHAETTEIETDLPDNTSYYHSAVAAKGFSHEDYIRHYYESRNYKVNYITINKESNRNRHVVAVDVAGPYGESIFTHRVSSDRLETDSWYKNLWEPDEIAYYPNADSFLGNWYFHGETADISIMIHKLDLYNEMIAYEYSCDCDYIYESYRTNQTRYHYTGESDRVLTSKVKYDEGGYYFEIDKVKVYLDPITGVNASMITLSQSDNYNTIEQYLPATRILGDDIPMFQEGNGLSENNSRGSYKDPNSRFNWKGLANPEGDGTRLKQTYFLWGAYQSLSGTAYVARKQDLPEYLDKSAEIYIYGDGKLLKTITDKEVKNADYELFFDVDISNVKELTFDMPGERLYEKDRGWGADVPLLNLANLIVSKHDAYQAVQFTYSREGALEFQSPDKADEYTYSSNTFYEQTGFRPIFLTVTYDKRFFVLNDNWEYDLNEQEVRKYAEAKFDEIAKPGTNSFLIIYFSDGVEQDRYAVDRYFYFYSPDNETAVDQIKSWFFIKRSEFPDYVSYKVIDTLEDNDVMLLDF